MSRFFNRLRTGGLVAALALAALGSGVVAAAPAAGVAVRVS
jgi:hypothetical protein